MRLHVRLLLSMSIWLFSTQLQSEIPLVNPTYMECLTQKLQDAYWLRWYRTHINPNQISLHADMKAELRAWQRINQMAQYPSHPHSLLKEERWPQENLPEEAIFAQPTVELWPILPLHTESTMSPTSQ